MSLCVSVRVCEQSKEIFDHFCECFNQCTGVKKSSWLEKHEMERSSAKTFQHFMPIHSKMVWGRGITTYCILLIESMCGSRFNLLHNLELWCWERRCSGLVFCEATLLVCNLYVQGNLKRKCPVAFLLYNCCELKSLVAFQFNPTY